MSLTEQSLGEIARSMPGATGILRKFHMDFCCGDVRSLGEEATREHVDLPELLRSLEQLRSQPSEDKDWLKTGTQGLIAHILEQVHADHPQAPHGVATHLIEMQQALLTHMTKEEQVLFPMLMHGQSSMAGGPISVMEHVQHGEALERMLMLTHQLVLPEDACNSWRALYIWLSELRDDLMEHIRLEHNILFKRSDIAENMRGGKYSCG